jgi:hypothetical protein
MYVTRSYFAQRGSVYRCEQSFDCSPHLSLVLFVTQVMRCEMVFEIIRNRVGFLVRMLCYS